MDFITNLPEVEGCNSILTIVDRFTKLVKLHPLHFGTEDSEAKVCADIFFDRVVREYGLPNSIVADRDPRWTSLFWRSLCSRMDSKLHLSSAHHPQTDGQTERYHRTIEQCLRAVLLEGEADWKRAIGIVEYALNSSIQ